MRAKYNRTDDVLMLEVIAPGAATIDDAEEIGPLIVHYSPTREVVLIEILDAREFLGKLMCSTEGATIEL